MVPMTTNHTTTVQTPECTMCGRASTLTVPTQGLVDWKDNDFPIQRAFPTLTVDEREMLMTGIHPDCWDAIFGEEPADDDHGDPVDR